MPTPATPHSADILIIGWGLAGLVAAGEAVAAGKNVVIVDQEPRTNLGGQAWWSFGGLFFIDSPEQRRMGIKDSFELAHQDWFGNAGFDREEDAFKAVQAGAKIQGDSSGHGAHGTSGSGSSGSGSGSSGSGSGGSGASGSGAGGSSGSSGSGGAGQSQ